LQSANSIMQDSRDLQRTFTAMPGLFLVLRPNADFTIVAASAGYPKATYKASLNAFSMRSRRRVAAAIAGVKTLATAGRLGGVKRQVGVAVQRVDVPPISGRQHDADAGPNRDARALHFARRGQAAEQARCKRLDLGKRDDRVQENRELVAAQALTCVTRTLRLQTGYFNAFVTATSPRTQRAQGKADDGDQNPHSSLWFATAAPPHLVQH
jgi:hypothetical protein